MAVRKKTPVKSPTMRKPAHGGGLLRVGGTNRGGPGRPPDEFKKLCQQLASRDETIDAVTAILADPAHPAYLGALKWATEQGYGKAQESVNVTASGGLTIRVVKE